MTDAVPPPPPGSDPDRSQPVPPYGTTPPASQITVTNPFVNLHQLDLALAAAGGLMLILSLFPFYTIDVFGGSGNAWDGFFSWFAVLLTLAGTAALLLPRMGVSVPGPTRLITLGCWVGAVVFLLLALVTFPHRGEVPLALRSTFDATTGHGFGLYASLLVAIAASGLAFLRLGAPRHEGVARAR